MNLIDQINFIGKAHASETVFKLISAMQNDNPGSQVTASGMLFLLLCERYKCEPREVLDKAAHVLFDAFGDSKNAHIRAVKQYIYNEL